MSPGPQVNPSDFQCSICELLGLQAKQIKLHDPATPIVPAYFYTEEAAETDHVLHNPISRPMSCHVPALNLTILSVFHWGMVTLEELKMDTQLSAHARHFHPPAHTLARFEHIVQPLVQNMGRKIDLFQFSSYLWDADHLSRMQGRIDAARGRKPNRYHSAVNSEALETYAQRLKATLLALSNKINPSVPILWRTSVLLCLFW